MSEQPVKNKEFQFDKSSHRNGQLQEYPQPKRLQMGRQLRGMTQRDVADETGIDQALISKYENGRYIPQDDLHKIAKVLRLPEEFFYRQTLLHAFDGADMAMFRRQQTTSKKIQDQILMEMNRVSENIQDLFESVDVRATNPIPMYEPDEGSMEEIEDIADRTRLQLRVPPGPIQSMTRIMESMGVAIVLRSLPPKVDALVSSYGSLSILLLNSANLLGGRQRLTLAHELGHLVMHNALNFSYEVIEQQAFRFGSAFLMPAQEIKPKLRNITMERLIALSAQWGVSVQALIRRAHDLDILNDRQYQYWNQQLSKNGYRTAEPITIPLETPRLMKALIDIHLSELRYTVEELADALTMEEWEFRESYLGEKQIQVLPKQQKPILKLDMKD